MDRLLRDSPPKCTLGRALIQLARENLSADQIATRLGIAPVGVLAVAKRLGIYLKPPVRKNDREQ
jgi:hypothetical protein